MKHLKIILFVAATLMFILFLHLNSQKKTEILSRDVYRLKQSAIENFKENSVVFHPEDFHNCTDTEHKNIVERIKNQTQLVLYLSKKQCVNCGIFEYNLLQKKMPQAKNIIILTNFKKEKDAHLWLEQNKVNYPVYNCKKTISHQMIEQYKPFFWIMDTTFVMQHTFQPIVDFPDLTNEYFSYIQEFL
ncbi:MAG: hypothetical protein LBR48_05655 [Dysgonamonadaceae bacterium]|jgi:hypothetical protein|nr:hypothetical protein [Dysgonamonadaceae bacterium]